MSAPEPGKTAGIVRGSLLSQEAEMVALKVTKIGEDVVVVLTEELRDALGVAEGGTLYAAQSSDGEVTLARRDMSLEARRSRGRAFIGRYKKTLDALAK